MPEDNSSRGGSDFAGFFIMIPSEKVHWLFKKDISLNRYSPGYCPHEGLKRTSWMLALKMMMLISRLGKQADKRIREVRANTLRKISR